ncbi:hypothetical protein EVAR_54803_1 [Eumeta japonica]|uniref:RNA-directed DNA polymerase from mobile element jockey n=1 Tax=Eumeta variegata TaxID=151549 RepID=A0A4C1Y333_EUMVA|nr:hypothetical protein EVAR_54803_1 [Eumeta japonica]
MACRYVWLLESRTRGAAGTHQEQTKSNSAWSGHSAPPEPTPCAWAPVAPPYLRHCLRVFHDFLARAAARKLCKTIRTGPQTAMLWQIWLQHKTCTGSLTEYGPEVAASSIEFSLLSESSDGSLPISPSISPIPLHRISYSLLKGRHARRQAKVAVSKILFKAARRKRHVRRKAVRAYADSPSWCRHPNDSAGTQSNSLMSFGFSDGRAPSPSRSGQRHPCTTLLTGRSLNMPNQLGLREQDVEWKSCIPYLSVYIDRSLRMIPQVDYAIQQSRASRAKLRPVQDSQRTKITIYNCYIRSRLTYAAPAWYALCLEQQRRRLQA